MNSPIKRFLLASVASLNLSFLLSAPPAFAQAFNNLIFFGDSNTDSGIYAAVRGVTNTNAAFVAQYGYVPNYGSYTTKPGLMWSVALGQMYGISVTPAASALAQSLGFQLTGSGNNYAAGGARVSYTDPTNPQIWSVTNQISTYLAATGGRADPNTLYTVYVSANDLKTTTVGGAGNIVSPQNIPQLTALALEMSALPIQLRDAGARFIFVPNGVSSNWSQAAATAVGVAYNAETFQSRTYYNQTLWSTLAANNVNFIPGDFSSVLNYVLINPSQFGFTVTSRLTPACGAVLAPACQQANWVAPNADTSYVWADGEHLTSGVQRITADYTYNLLNAPGQISLMPLSQINSRAAVIKGIRSQMPDKTRVVGERHAWISGDVTRLRNGDLLDRDSGKTVQPVSISAGVDYQVAPQWLAGVSASFSRATQAYRNGGSFDTDDVAASLYVGFRNSSFWFNGIGTGGMVNASSSRSANLGITVEENKASPKGSGVSVAAQTGFDFGVKLNGYNVTYGPILGAVLQRARLGAFNETNAQSGLTALNFNSQSRDSAVGEIGYQGSVKLGSWQVFSNIVWNQEMKNEDASIVTSLPTITAPSYSLPAAALPKGWATVTAGAKYSVNKDVNAYLIGNVRGLSNNSSGFGLSTGLNAAF